MAVDIVMPRLGWTMETGTIAEWLKSDGDAVQAGEIIFTVESDKAIQEVEALESGILRIRPSSTPGTEVSVGTVVAYLVGSGEEVPRDGQVGSVAAPVPEVVTSTAAHGAATATAVAAAATDRQTPPISPRARRVALELGVDWTVLNGSGRTGRIVERDVRALAAQATTAVPTRITPLARRDARQAGVDLDEVAARLPGQRITRAAIAVAASGVATSSEGGGVAEHDGAGTRPWGGIRKVIAQRMAQSAHTVAAVTLMTEADASELVLVRTKIKASLNGSDRPVPTYNDLLMRLVALALLEHPLLNSSLVGDTGIAHHDAVHVGLAVDTQQGLLVPVVRNAHLKSVQTIAAESAQLIERARAGKAAPEDLRGGTFTITNLGMFDIDAFTPIINLPECAILGVGRIVARPVVIDEDAAEIAVRKMVSLSLTVDHRVVDGAPAARFLQQIKRGVEQPFGWLTA